VRPSAFAVLRLAAALAALHEDSDARLHFDALGVIRFIAVTRGAYAPLADLDRSARAAGYPRPA
jgi:hypothetical protein